MENTAISVNRKQLDEQESKVTCRLTYHFNNISLSVQWHMHVALVNDTPQSNFTKDKSSTSFYLRHFPRATTFFISKLAAYHNTSGFQIFDKLFQKCFKQDVLRRFALFCSLRKKKLIRLLNEVTVFFQSMYVTNCLFRCEREDKKIDVWWL